MFAFDLDGTLVASEQAVYDSYRAVGVSPPDGFFTKPWDQWLPQCCGGLAATDVNDLHKAKNIEYLKRIAKGEVAYLPLMTLFLQLQGRNTAILTGASDEAARAICSHFEMRPEILLCSLTVTAKIRWLNSKTPGIMFEDQLQVAHRLRRETRWTICHAL